jgi:prepilin-type N-terminal cleavage/methylation domain-containing protein
MRTSPLSRTSRHRQGLTLIELVAALVLLSVLMVALTGIIPRFANRHDDATATHQTALERTARRLLDRLAQDFAAAQTASIENTTLSLRGIVSPTAVGRDSNTNQIVRYAVEHRANRQCLIRSQHGQAELLCCGEFRLDIRSFADDDTAVEVSTLDASAINAGTAEVPLASWLDLALRDHSGVLLAETSVIREPASASLLQVYEERR